MQAYVTAPGLFMFVIPLVAALGAAILALTVMRPVATPGWSRVKAGAGYWFTLALTAGLSVLIGWVWAFVGSSRSDGVSQMQIAWWLAFLFGCGAAYIALRIVRLNRMALRWRGEVMQWSSTGPVPMRSLRSLGSTLFGDTRVTFSNGQSVLIDPVATGAGTLIRKLEDLNGLTPSDGAGDH